MIGKIKGYLSEVYANIGLIETNSGVFYQLYLTPEAIAKTKIKSKTEFYTYLQVRDDALILFGFLTNKEHDFFKILLTVPGVGPKTAFNIISSSKIDQLISAVKKGDSHYFTSIPGLGRKTALKIILELSHKLDEEFNIKKTMLSEEDRTVVDALVSLGFKHSHAYSILSKIDKNLSIEDKIRTALKQEAPSIK